MKKLVTGCSFASKAHLTTERPLYTAMVGLLMHNHSTSDETPILQYTNKILQRFHSYEQLAKPTYPEFS
jgi:hypothetical protein